MTVDEIALDTLDITDTDLYHSRGYPWREWDLLRREAPVFWYDRPGYRPFWAITRHEDIGTISRHSDVFISTQRLRVYPEPQDSAIVNSRLREAEQVGMIESAPLNFIDMDEPEHSRFRSLINRFFTPKANDRRLPMVERLADERVSILEQKLRDARPGDPRRSRDSRAALRCAATTPIRRGDDPSTWPCSPRHEGRGSSPWAGLTASPRARKG